MSSTEPFTIVMADCEGAEFVHNLGTTEYIFNLYDKVSGREMTEELLKQAAIVQGKNSVKFYAFNFSTLEVVPFELIPGALTARCLKL